jgi:23S rRNA G2069 N7-methylase RlmK/C1962 C5-methylase RlmI
LQNGASTRKTEEVVRQESFEEEQEDLDPHRREERSSAAMELSGRIRQKGVLLTGRETSSQLDDLVTAIDRFEAAVITRGGDLFINTPSSDPPESPDFVIPRRAASEDPEAYAARINEAARRLEKADL